jgi:hypothetical protein
VRLVAATFALAICFLAVVDKTSTYARTIGPKSKPIELKKVQPPAQQAVRLRYYGGPKSPMYP